MSNRSYNHYCGLAYALDRVGERWSLLIVRELIAGPRRFKDLMTGLPGISTNLLTERLKRLEQSDVLMRRVLPPPAGSTVYELTPMGYALEPMLLELGKWGSQFVPPTWNDTLDNAALLGAGSYALTLKTFFRPELAQANRECYALHIEDEVLHVAIEQGTLDVRQGASLHADAIFHLEMPVYIQLLTRQISPAAALEQGLVRVEGDPQTLQRFIDLCGLPLPA